MARLASLLIAFFLLSCVQSALMYMATPLLSVALSSRGGDDQTAQLIASLESKQDWAGLSRLAQQRLLREADNSGWWVVLGYAQVQLGEYQRASESFRQAVERNPEDIDAWNMLGDSQRLNGRHAVAVQTLEHAASIDSTSSVTRYLLGEAFRSDNRLERAKMSYREALRLEPRFGMAWFGLGTVLVRTGPRDELLGVVERLKVIDPPLARELERLQAR